MPQMPTSRVLIFSSVGAATCGIVCANKATSRLEGMTPTALMLPSFINDVALLPVATGVALRGPNHGEKVQ